jgi:hypothetical protein
MNYMDRIYMNKINNIEFNDYIIYGCTKTIESIRQ